MQHFAHQGLRQANSCMPDEARDTLQRPHELTLLHCLIVRNKYNAACEES